MSGRLDTKCQMRAGGRAFSMVVGLAILTGWQTAVAEQRLSYPEDRDLLSVSVGETEQVRVYMGLQTVGRLQGFDQRRVSIPQPPGEDGEPTPPRTPGSLEWAAQYPFGSMDFKAEFFDADIVTYWEFYIASRPHADAMQGGQGYVLFRGLPGGQLDGLFEYVEVKAGQFEINFGDHRYRRSSNARVQRNALIGNAVVDPRATETGFEFRTRRGPVRASVGITDGSESESFQRGRGIGYNAKLWANPVDQLRLSLSGYHADHSRNPAGRGNSQTNLHRTLRDGGPYGGVLAEGNAPGQVFVGAGQKVSTGQFDMTSRLGDLELYANVGYAEDSRLGGSTAGERKEAYWYYTAESVYSFTDRFYGALRYSGAAADYVGGDSSSGNVHRYQAGIGYRISESVLAKTEYVYQQYSGFDAGQRVSGVDAGTNPSFEGLLIEVSLAF